MTRSVTPIRIADLVPPANLGPLPVLPGEKLFRRKGCPLRIMHVFDRLDVGGTEKVILKLVNGFEGGVFQHSICTLRGAEPSTTSWASGVEIMDAGREGATFQFNVPRLAKLMKAFRPDIVHSRNWGGIEAIVAARMARVPVILHSEHGYELEMSDGLPIRQRMFRHLVYRWATAVFTVSQELRSYHAAQAWCNPEKIRVLYNGVDGERFQPRPQVGSAIRRHLGIPADGFVVGFVGRMVPLKDTMTLLRAVETLAPSSPQLHVLLVGSGPELARLQAYVLCSPLLNGRVTFPGSSDAVPDLLNAMDVFVLPSLVEGMSNTVLEALATGLPVVATRVGGNPEIVEDSVCGYLFPPGDASQLSARLATLLQNRQLRARFGRAARERAVKHFSLSSMLGRYYDLYVGMAEQQGAIPRVETYVRN